MPHCPTGPHALQFLSHVVVLCDVRFMTLPQQQSESLTPRHGGSFTRVAATDPTEFPPLPHTHFLKAVKWSPDGTQLLCNSEDHLLRCYTLPYSLYTAAEDTEADCTRQPDTPLVLRGAKRFKESETVYDYAWYPGMADAASSCFAATARDCPIHLWDLVTGRIRATYRAYDHADEVLQVDAPQGVGEPGRQCRSQRGCRGANRGEGVG